MKYSEGRSLMRKQIKKILILVGVFITFCIFNQNKVNAASASISGSQTVTAGQTVTVTASVNAGAWNLTLSGGGQSQPLVGQTSSAGNDSASASITFVATQNTTVTLTGDITDFNSNYSQTVSQSAQITVQSASTGGNTSSGNNSNPGNGSTGTGTGGTTGNTGSGSSNGGASSGGSSGSSSTGTSSGSSTSATNNANSNNANLSNLGIRPNDFSGFTPNRTSYSVTVPNSVTSVEVYANIGQTGQKISGTGTKSLNEGANSFNVVVTAPNGTTTKTYTVTVNREASENTEEENQEDQNTTDENAEVTDENAQVTDENSEFGLSELKIDGIELDPSFSVETYEYTAKLIGNREKLDITAIATEENAKVEITGNEALKEGENLITILVTNEAGDKTAAYQIKLTKTLVDEEAIAREQELEKQEKNKKIIAIALVIAVIVIIAIVLIIRRIRNKKLAEEYSIPYQGMDDNDEYYDGDENSYQKITDKFDNSENDDWFNRDLTLEEPNTNIDLEENIQDNDKRKRKKKNKKIEEIDENIEDEDVDDGETEEYEFKPAFSSKEELREQYLNQSFDKDITFEDEKRKGKGRRFK